MEILRQRAEDLRRLTSEGGEERAEQWGADLVAEINSVGHSLNQLFSNPEHSQVNILLSSLQYLFILH